MTQYKEETAKRLAIHARHTILPADLETPVGIYLKVRDLYPCSALLESSDYHTNHGSVSLIGVCPIATFTVNNDRVTATYPDKTTVVTDLNGGDRPSVPEQLKRYIESYMLTNDDDIKASNGFFGITSYDAVRYFEPAVKIQPREAALEDVPDMIYVLFRYVIEVNHYKNQLTVTENLMKGETPETETLLSTLRCTNFAQYKFAATSEATSPISDTEYMEMVRTGIKHCMRGDVFQVVLSRRYERTFTGDEFNVYRALRCINPSPYLFYFDMGNFKVFGSSPETHLRIEDGRAYIDPIAGTFRRTGNDSRDQELAEALLKDEKENAEHIMLVDLARNDLARSGGDVTIEFLKQIQYYSHVIHMVSRVSASLPDGTDTYRLFADTFPAGTLSGAPKVRAMQIINDVEPHPRSVYAGCIGMIGFDGSLNQAITIRSFLSHSGRLYCQAGAGIVAASVPENELKEVQGKLGALNKAVEFAKMFDK